jgi:hypothetical protein
MIHDVSVTQQTERVRYIRAEHKLLPSNFTFPLFPTHPLNTDTYPNSRQLSQNTSKMAPKVAIVYVSAPQASHAEPSRRCLTILF